MITLTNKMPITAGTVVHFFRVSNRLWCKTKASINKAALLY